MVLLTRQIDKVTLYGSAEEPVLSQLARDEDAAVLTPQLSHGGEGCSYGRGLGSGHGDADLPVY